MTLTNFPPDDLLDLPPWIGQRQASFRFQLANRVSGINLGPITPIKGAQLGHNTSRIIKRQLTMALGVEESASINPLTDQVEVFMVFPDGVEYPLGQYIFTDASYQQFVDGTLSNMTLNDKMYIIDQQIETAFSSLTIGQGNFPGGVSVARLIAKLLADQPVQFSIEATEFGSFDSWSAGTTRGQILESLALTGDYFSPWFDNTGVMRFIRAFNPINRVPDFDWDSGKQVVRASILQSSNIFTAPNRYIVISNAPSDTNVPTYGSADVPQNAPHSIASRGFVIPQVVDLQALTSIQCAAIAENLVQRQTVFETINIATAPDPRHDSYNVIKWQDSLWLELSWTLTLTEGAPMQHTFRRAYR
jgi:hypothetical protein